MEMAISKIYPLKYSVEAGEFSKEELLADPTCGGCDSLFYASIIYTQDGWVSVNMLSLDGKTQKEMSVNAMYKVWVLLGKILSSRPDLSENKRFIAGTSRRSYF